MSYRVHDVNVDASRDGSADRFQVTAHGPHHELVVALDVQGVLRAGDSGDGAAIASPWTLVPFGTGGPPPLRNGRGGVRSPVHGDEKGWRCSPPLRRKSYGCVRSMGRPVAAGIGARDYHARH